MNETATFQRNNDDVLDKIYLSLLITEAVAIIPATCGNSLILVCLSRYKSLRSVVGIIIGSLAVSDLLSAAILMPMDILGQELGLLSDKYFCLVRTGGYLALFGVTVLNMMVLSVERFLALAYPLKYLSKASRMKKMTKWTLLAIWVSMTAMGVAPVLGWNTFNSARLCSVTDIYTDEYHWLLTITYAFGTIINMIFLIAVIALVMKKLNTSGTATTSFRDSRNFKKTYLVLLISGWFVICWGPYCILTLLRLFGANISDNFSRWCLLPGVMNIAFNWMIYGFGNIKLRQAMFYTITCKRHQISSNSYSMT